ncbi:MAG: glycine--tRNA ligase subunit beta, partial [Clostridia bacterium]|nr:glycine--tRNA ligase subunit beta [Clostridia bacterium]
EHQRYFTVFDQSGRLLSKFIAVSNGTADVDTVAKGNEKVLRARLEDARFFYGEDLKEPLEKKVDRLKEVVFLEGLGTLYDKTQRIRTLAAFIAQIWDLPGAAMADLDRAAYLCKADLVTNMVYEFPELQGVMGSYYAAAQGEREAVTQGIREHYQPRFMGDEVPKTPIGR